MAYIEQDGERKIKDRVEILLQDKRSFQRTANKMQYILHCNPDLTYFVTLTFKGELNDKETLKKFRNFRVWMRRNYPKIKYMIVPERHESGKIHFHALMNDCFHELGFEDSGKVACHVLPKGCCSKEYYQQMLKQNKFEPSGTDGQTIYNITAFKHGFTTAVKKTDDDKALDYIAEYINKGVRVFGLHSRRFWYSKNLNLPKEYKQKYHTNFDIETDIRDVARNILARNYGIISYHALGVKTKCIVDMGDLGKYMKVRILSQIKPEKPIEKTKVENESYSKRMIKEIAQAKRNILRQVQGELAFD